MRYAINMKKLFAVVLFLLFPLLSHATVLLSGSFENGLFYPFRERTTTGATVVTDSTAPDGTGSLKFTYPAGLYGGVAPDIVSKSYTQTNEIWIQYYFKYSSNWRWNTIMNKQIYVVTGSQSLPEEVNFFIGAKSQWGEQIGFSTQHNNDSSTNQTFRSFGWTLTTGVWHKVVIHVKMNTAGVQDGIAQVWVDDVLRINQSNVLYRPAGYSYGFSNFQMTPIYGGGQETIPEEQYLWFDHVIVQSTPFGATGDQSPPYVDTFSPGDGSTGVAVGTTSASFHFKDLGDGADNTSLTVACSSPSIATKHCGDANFACSGTSADYTATLSGLSLTYGQAVSCTINGQDLAATPNVMSAYTYNFTVVSDPGGALPGTDDFNRASLGSEYTAIYGLSALTITSNQLAAAGSRGVYRNDWTGGEDQYNKIQLSTVGGTNPDVGVIARMQSGSNTSYAFDVYASSFGSSSTIEIDKSVNGSVSALIMGTHTFSANDNVKITTTGSNPVVVKGYVNDVEVLSYSDSAADRITGGYPGWYISNTTIRLDNAAWGVEGAGESTTLAVTTSTIPNGTEGAAYSQTLSATGGVSPYTWSVVADALPTGLSLASATGVISGIPTTAGSSSFTVQATDSAGSPATDNQVLSITINPAAPTGQTTVIITDIADTYIWPAGGANGDNNVSSSEKVEVYQWPSYSWANRILDNVSLASLPANISITAASLEMYMYGYDGSGGTNPMRTYVYPVTNMPDISTVTGNNFAGTLGTPLPAVDVSLTTGWYSLNVLEAVQAAYAAGTPLYLAIDGGSDGTQDTNRIFASMDHATTAWRPRLKVSYTQLSAPAGPSTLTPGKGRWKGPGRFRTFH